MDADSGCAGYDNRNDYSDHSRPSKVHSKVVFPHNIQAGLVANCMVTTQPKVVSALIQNKANFQY